MALRIFPALNRTSLTLIIRPPAEKPSSLSICFKKLNSTLAGKPTSSMDEILAKPSWSVSSLLPSNDQPKEECPIAPKQLRHLLRLSALPEPKDAREETKMLETLASQLHFVRDIQQVDTEGVEPLRALRDETMVGEKETEISLASLNDALEQEEVRGKHYKRIRRKDELPVDTKGAEDWDALAYAERKIGKYFVVDNEKDGNIKASQKLPMMGV